MGIGYLDWCGYVGWCFVLFMDLDLVAFVLAQESLSYIYCTLCDSNFLFHLTKSLFLRLLVRLDPRFLCLVQSISCVCLPALSHWCLVTSKSTCQCLQLREWHARASDPGAYGVSKPDRFCGCTAKLDFKPVAVLCVCCLDRRGSLPLQGRAVLLLLQAGPGCARAGHGLGCVAAAARRSLIR